MKQLLQQALDALLEFCDESDVIDALRAAIAQPESEPAGYFINCGEPLGWCEVADEHKFDSDVSPLYKAPPQPAAYVPLSEEDIDRIYQTIQDEGMRMAGKPSTRFAKAVIERAVRGTS